MQTQTIWYTRCITPPFSLGVIFLFLPRVHLKTFLTSRSSPICRKWSHVSIFYIVMYVGKAGLLKFHIILRFSLASLSFPSLTGPIILPLLFFSSLSSCSQVFFLRIDFSLHYVIICWTSVCFSSHYVAPLLPAKVLLISLPHEQYYFKIFKMIL